MEFEKSVMQEPKTPLDGSSYTPGDAKVSIFSRFSMRKGSVASKKEPTEKQKQAGIN